MKNILRGVIPVLILNMFVRILLQNNLFNFIYGTHQPKYKLVH